MPGVTGEMGVGWWDAVELFREQDAEGWGGHSRRWSLAVRERFLRQEGVVCGGGGDSTMEENIHDTAGGQKKMEIVVGPGEGIRPFPTPQAGREPLRADVQGRQP